MKDLIELIKDYGRNAKENDELSVWFNSLELNDKRRVYYASQEGLYPNVETINGKDRKGRG